MSHFKGVLIVAVVLVLLSPTIAHGGDANATFFYLVVAATIYFLPTLISGAREHHLSEPIFYMNLIWGWTLVGWLIALFLALRGNNGKTPQQENQRG